MGATNRINRKYRVSGLTMMELLVVLAIIGILVMIALPNFMGVVSDARSTEAKEQLSHLHMLQKQEFLKKSSFTGDMDKLRFIAPKLVTDGGNANYTFEIVESSNTTFKAIARAVVDFDGDGVYNEWSIDQDKNLIEVVPD